MLRTISCRHVVGLLCGLLALVCASPAPADSASPITFSTHVLHWDNSLTEPTSLQFGPDGRLYVAQLDGIIRVFTIERHEDGSYQVVGSESIDLVQDIPNHNDDGTLDSGHMRYVTGLLVTGSAEHPIIYVASSDYRTALDRVTWQWSTTSLGIDTNSGVLSRLTWDGDQWVKLDLVRGLPRSVWDHIPNGMALDTAQNLLYIAIAGLTNMGAPYARIGSTPEYALSAAVLTIDLNAIGDTTYDLPTLDDPDRPGNPDLNDPFGGNAGLNQAVIQADSPVQLYATGFRNTYDLVLTKDGNLYGFDNGANGDMGGPPVHESINGRCTNDVIDDPGTMHLSDLHLITKGYYGGHPNPTRGNAANTFGGQSPIIAASPIECMLAKSDPNNPDRNDALYAREGSLNGMDDYTASAFGGAMQGDLLVTDLSGSVLRIGLNDAGDTFEYVTTLFDGFSAAPLDVTAQGDDGVFPGTIWVTELYSGTIWVFEPVTDTTTMIESEAADSGVVVVQQPEPIEGLSVVTNAPVLVNTPLSLEAQVSSGDGILYAWDFGDGSTSIGEAAATHPYAAPGSYTVTVEAINRISKLKTTFDVMVTDVPPGAAGALMTIEASPNPDGSSTYETGAFKLVNLSTGGQRITKLHIDLSTALIGEIIFSPSGKAGDVLGKPFTPDVDDGVGVIGSHYASPYANGYIELTVEFDNFTPDKAFAFSADADPAGVLGLPLEAAYHVSSMSGLELTGTTLTLTFDDGTILTAQPMPIPGSIVGSQTPFLSDTPAPQIALLGIDSTPATVSKAEQTLRISAPPGAQVALMVAEAGLDLEGVPNGGYQIDPYEVNQVISFTMQYVIVGADGTIDVPVMLKHTTDIGGYNLITAAIKADTGSYSRLADKLIVYLEGD